MLILGVDPGTIVTGLGIISYDKNSITRVHSGHIKLPALNSLPQKLEIIYNELDKIIKTYRPDEFAIETAFYGKNVQSAMKIGYARGVSLLAAVHNRLPASEYSPREIKKSVTGKGAASKEQVFYMITTLLNLKNVKMRLDESDALAVAICHAFRYKTPIKTGKSWKDYIEAFPEKLIQN